MLAVTHPLANFRNNLHVMSNSLVCTQVKVVNSTAKLVKVALAPINGQCSYMAYTYTKVMMMIMMMNDDDKMYMFGGENHQPHHKRDQTALL